MDYAVTLLLPEYSYARHSVYKVLSTHTRTHTPTHTHMSMQTDRRETDRQTDRQTDQKGLVVPD